MKRYFVLLLACIAVSCPLPWEPVRAQTSLSSPAILWHATDCRTNYPTATAREQCGNLSDLSVYVCKTPSAGGNTSQCDQLSEWAKYNDLSDGDKGDITVSGGVWNIDPLAVGTAELANDAVTDAKVVDTITASNYQPLDADLTTLAGKTIAGTGTNVRLSTGSFATNECVKVDASGNFATAGAACGSGSGSSTLGQVVANGRDVIDADAVGTAVRIGDIGQGHLFYCNNTEKCVWTVTDAQDLNIGLADTFTWNLKDAAGATIMSADETTKVVSLTVPLATASGGTGLAAAADDNVLVGNGTVWQTKALTSCSNATTSKVLYNSTTNAFSCGTDQDSGAGGISDADKGDITVTGTGAVWTIDANTITNTKMADDAINTVEIVNNAVTDAKVVDTITASNYLPLIGGTLTGQLRTASSGIEFTESDTNPTCAAGNFTLYADLSEARIKKCSNGVASDIAAANNISTIAPTATDDIDLGYSVGSHWVETTSTPDVIYEAVDVTPDAAVWRIITDTDTDDQSLQEAFNQGKTIFNANSEANAVKIGIDNGDGDCTDAGEGCWEFWVDAASGPQWKAVPDGQYTINAPTGFDVAWQIAGTTLVRLNHTTSKLEYENGGRPLKSVEVAGHEFGACAYTDEVVAASKPKVGVFTCTDIDTDGFFFDWVPPLNWDLGTVTVRLNSYSTNATPTGNVVLSCSGQAVSDGDVIANSSTTGEQTVTLALATQYKEEQATSAAITLNGTPAAGDHLYMHCDVDATGTTATMANVRINANAKVFYTVTSTSE